MDTMLRAFPKTIFYFLFSLLTSGCGSMFYIVGQDSDQEPGLMRICWLRDGRADYSQNPPVCRSPEEVVWDHVPLSVFSPVDNEQLNEAVRLFNRQFNCDLLVRNHGQPHSADVSVYLNVPLEEGTQRPGGSTRHWRLAGGRIVSHVETHFLTYPATTTRVLIHEMGHVFFLAHDSFSQSVMYYFTPDVSYQTRARFTTRDRRLINERYCHEHQ